MRNLIMGGLMLAIGIGIPQAVAGDKNSIDAQALLKKMSAAHGGTKAWQDVPAFKFSTAMHLTSLKPGEGRTWSDSWRHYTVVLDPDTSRAFVDVPHDGQEGMEAGFDGKRLWRTDYDFDPSYQDGAMMLNWYHSSIVTLPFLLNANGADIQYQGMKSLPDRDGDFHKIKIDYSPLGWAGTYEVYLDPDTKRLAGWEQGAMTPPLPGDPVPGLPSPPGKPLRVIDQYMTVGDFVLPRRYVTYSKGNKLGGVHMVLDAEILDTFEAAKAAPPLHAKIAFEKDI